MELNSDEMEKKDSNNFLLTFLAGATAGAIIGLMYAPERGSETRKKISESSKRFMDDFEDFTVRAKETFSDIAEKITETINSLADADITSAALNLRGNWNEIRGRLKKEFSELTDQDLTYIEGQENELIGRLQRKLSKSKNEILNILKDFMPIGSRN